LILQKIEKEKGKGDKERERFVQGGSVWGLFFVKERESLFRR
jgi:hypothetical protein